MQDLVPWRPRLLVIVALALMSVGCGGARTLRPGDQLPVSCLDEPDRGPCGASQVRFYYDYRDDRCKPFSYGGCGGNVPFETLERCLDFCGARR